MAGGLLIGDDLDLVDHSRPVSTASAGPLDIVEGPEAGKTFAPEASLLSL